MLSQNILLGFGSSQGHICQLKLHFRSANSQSFCQQLYADKPTKIRLKFESCHGWRKFTNLHCSNCQKMHFVSQKTESGYFCPLAKFSLRFLSFSPNRGKLLFAQAAFIFCENPLPSRKTEGEKYEFVNEYLNFRFTYSKICQIMSYARIR